MTMTSELKLKDKRTNILRFRIKLLKYDNTKVPNKTQQERPASDTFGH